MHASVTVHWRPFLSSSVLKNFFLMSQSYVHTAWSLRNPDDSPTFSPCRGWGGRVVVLKGSCVEHREPSQVSYTIKKKTFCRNAKAAHWSESRYLDNTGCLLMYYFFCFVFECIKELSPLRLDIVTETYCIYCKTFISEYTQFDWETKQWC